MNRYLALLCPPPAQVYETRFGDAVRATALHPDPVSQSPRIYAAVRQGGGVLHDPAAAEALSRAGFTVTQISPTPGEVEYLSSFDERFRAASQLFLVTCEGGRAVEREDGVRACVPFEGLRRISFEEASAMGVIKASDLEPPKKWTQRALSYVVFASDKDPTPEILRRATASAEARARLERTIEAMSSQAQVSGRPLAGPLLVVWEQGVRLLAKTAQPAAIFARAYGEPKIGLAPMAIAAGVAGVVIVLGIGAAIWYLGEQQKEIVGAQMDAYSAYLEQTKRLSACVSDTSLTRQDRALCKTALDSVPKPPDPAKGPADVLEALSEAAPYITGLALLGAGIFYFGPVARELGKAGAQGVKAARQGISSSSRRQLGA